MATLGEVGQYELLEVIGKGTYGKVFKARRKSNGDVICLKQVTLDSMSQREQEETLNEAEVFSRVDHFNIIKHHESFVENGTLNMVMDFAVSGDLFTKLRQQQQQNAPFSEDQLWTYLIQIAMGLHHLHEKRILHRDIKPQNIFLDEHNNVKIGDFGLGRILGSGSQFACTVIGTPLYMSPELCEEQPYDSRSDVWALGCLMYELATFRPPFMAKNQLALAKKIVSDEPAVLPPHYSNELKFLIMKLLEKSPARRPDIAHIMQYSQVRIRIERAQLEQFHAQKYAEFNAIVADLTAQVADLTSKRAQAVRHNEILAKAVAGWKSRCVKAVDSEANMQALLLSSRHEVATLQAKHTDLVQHIQQQESTITCLQEQVQRLQAQNLQQQQFALEARTMSEGSIVVPMPSLHTRMSFCSDISDAPHDVRLSRDSLPPAPASAPNERVSPGHERRLLPRRIDYIDAENHHEQASQPQTRGGKARRYANGSPQRGKRAGNNGPATASPMTSPTKRRDSVMSLAQLGIGEVRSSPTCAVLYHWKRVAVNDSPPRSQTPTRARYATAKVWDGKHPIGWTAAATSLLIVFTMNPACGQKVAIKSLRYRPRQGEAWVTVKPRKIQLLELPVDLTGARRFSFDIAHSEGLEIAELLIDFDITNAIDEMFVLRGEQRFLRMLHQTPPAPVPVNLTAAAAGPAITVVDTEITQAMTPLVGQENVRPGKSPARRRLGAPLRMVSPNTLTPVGAATAPHCVLMEELSGTSPADVSFVATPLDLLKPPKPLASKLADVTLKLQQRIAETGLSLRQELGIVDADGKRIV
eukprot:TRINITY_DN12432_c0_g1_i1.p1 TRINITY_DN12432_c0_g1~~TRINITY_DN12432_c0_g1_i1.p1  ORF type:complete len:812 (+),score=171.27 TRINITY_DN12432_c0_g1_i1:80-2515(+)